MRQISNSRLLRPSELAERLGVSRVTVWRWERAGHLPRKRRVGPNVVGWLETEIDEWFAQTERTGLAESRAESGGAR